MNIHMVFIVNRFPSTKLRSQVFCFRQEQILMVNSIYSCSMYYKEFSILRSSMLFALIVLTVHNDQHLNSTCSETYLYRASFCPRKNVNFESETYKKVRNRFNTFNLSTHSRNSSTQLCTIGISESQVHMRFCQNDISRPSFAQAMDRQIFKGLFSAAVTLPASFSSRVRSLAHSLSQIGKEKCLLTKHNQCVFSVQYLLISVSDRNRPLHSKHEF